MSIATVVTSRHFFVEKRSNPISGGLSLVYQRKIQEQKEKEKGTAR
jgi:hypothetical protein